MSTTVRTSRGKPVTLAKTASPERETPKAADTKVADTKPAENKAAENKAAKPTVAKPASADLAVPQPVQEAATAQPAVEANVAFPVLWNDLLKAQSAAAMAWWDEVKDARTLADAIAVNAHHSRLQFERATGQAREMAHVFQKALEENAARLRTLLTPRS